MKSRTMSVAILAMVFLGAGFAVLAQDKLAGDSSSQAQPAVKTGKEYLGPIAESIRPYRPTNRDPFKRSVRPKGAKAKAMGTHVMGFPNLDARRAEFRQKVQQAVAADRPEPDPVSQYLVNELDVTGVFKDDRGFGAFVKAQPTGTMFFVRNGSKLYNGEVVRIMADEGEGASRVQFREVSYVETNGKQSPQERVVTKGPVTSRR